MNPFSYIPKKPYDYRQILIDFNRSLQTIRDKTLLISSIVTRIQELILAEAVYVFWENSNGTGYQLTNNNQDTPHNLCLLPGDGLVQWLKLNETPLTVSFAPEFAGIFSSNDASIIQLLEAVLIYSLKASGHFKGAILMAKRKDGKPYVSGDMEMLDILLDNLALAVENAIYHEERANHLRHIVRTDQLAVIGQLAASAVHEIRNPLTSIRSTIQYVQGNIRDAKKQNMVNVVLQEVDRINDILTGLLSFSRQNTPVKCKFDLAALTNQIIKFVGNTRMKKQIRMNVSCFAPSIPIVADEGQLRQVLMNIVLNAMDAIDNKGTVNVDIQSAVLDGEVFYTITVTDSGKGIKEESLEKIFDPFYTTKEDGTGLGLPISYSIIHRHKGSINIGNRPEGGAQVVIRLPQGASKKGE